ncbi:MAG: pyridoxamine 5'-phosphate oxidase family protein [Prochlorococcaceae cyanobacterium]|jgi:predicted pyridoxine 5'-phosphate oxidase superfamily flavin-nucleotide-binding protein
MSTPGWDRADSPFHASERAIQARLGVRERLDQQGRRVIRSVLNEQHRTFFRLLPYVLVGSVDGEGQPWASMLVGDPGFLSSPDEHTLQVAARPLPGDPLATHLAEGAPLGVLGIELASRRRNRVNGVVGAVDADGFTLQVEQTFGNCPQYIQARTAALQPFDSAAPRPALAVDRLGEEEMALIAAADTFFIATAVGAEAGAAAGVDVSHRGGRPGFVAINDTRTLTIPDYAGNHHFNTFGNLELNPRAGLLFVEFQRGDLLYLTGTAQVIWEGEEIRRHAGAERLLRFQLRQGRRVPGSLPVAWGEPAFSPFLQPLEPP